MAFTNSPLVDYTKISPNRTKNRNHKIDTITIHCVVGQLSVETLGNVFAPASRQASSNYGVGSDGRIGMYVEEKDRSWCTSNAANDHRAITIEVASDTKHPYTVNSKAMKSLINLIVDICKRNGIKKLLWKGDKSLIGQVNKQNMTVHRWFANKSCPGDYLYNKHSYIANEVNKRLGAVKETAKVETKEPTKTVAKPKDTSFKVKVTATALNIRKGAGTNYASVGVIKDKGVYTITETKSGKGSTKGWGKLKSGAGWISLDFATKI